MNTLLIGYDLNKTGQDYKNLIAAIHAEGTWWHHLDSTWLVRTGKTPIEMRDTLKTDIDKNDELLVIDVSNDAAAWSGFSTQASEWLRKYL